MRDQFAPHVRNFVDCVKSRKPPVSDLASSQRANVPCHLANLSLKLGRSLALGRGEAGRGRGRRGVAAAHQGIPQPLGPRAARGLAPWLRTAAAFSASRVSAWAPRRSASAADAAPARAAAGRYGLAYTSFAVRLRRGRDLVRGTGAPGLSAEAFVDLLRQFGADGGQMDITQLASTEPGYLDGIKRRLDESKLFLELAVGGKALEDEARFAEVAGVARRLGASRLRVALLNGRRYEDFKSREAWLEFADHWRQTLPRAKGFLERQRLAVGIENHKDWRTEELVALIRSVDSPWFGACVDFGNNVSFLEDPLETVTALAPYAVTTHLKDMAVRPYERGFELSEVPLGTGHLPARDDGRGAAKGPPRSADVPGDDHARSAQGAVQGRRLLVELRRSATTSSWPASRRGSCRGPAASRCRTFRAPRSRR